MARKVVVAMSGGVDSSVAALLLKRAGYEVSGMMARLWTAGGKECENRCCTPQAVYQARRVAGQLEIPFHVIDIQASFHEKVVGSYLQAYRQGWTPNPCIHCNQTIRWGDLFDLAMNTGADFLSTGHYAHSHKDNSGVVQLRKAIDPEKDQSYMLAGIPYEKLARTLFPLGRYRKGEVRKIAEEAGLEVAHTADSQDLCFLGTMDYRDFLLEQIPDVMQPGEIVDTGGKVLGQHRGLAAYTIGQRKGVSVPVPYPVYVVHKDLERNQLVVGGIEEIRIRGVIIDSMNWLLPVEPLEPFQAGVKIRYHSADQPAWITPIAPRNIHIRFDTLDSTASLGQAAVVYTGDQCLGGGIISAYLEDS